MTAGRQTAGRTEPHSAALTARITAIALDGLRAAGHPTRPGEVPGPELFEERREPAG